MALNNLTFNINASGLGTPLASEDHISGLVFYNDTLPTGFSSSAREKTVFSLEEAEALGIAEGDANHGVEWYHIREFFQKQPQGQLWIGYYDIPVGTADFAELETLQNAAQGKIKQAGIYYVNVAFATSQVTAIQSVVDTLIANERPLSVIYAGDISGVSDLSTLADLKTLASPNVSVTIGQDGAGKGKALFDSLSVSISDLGAKLGAVSFANVNESISWFEKFPMVTDGTEFDVAAFSNGDEVLTYSKASLEALDGKNYLFLVKQVDISNTYNNDSYTAEALTSDYSTIENNRTINKARRSLRTFILPKLGSPLRVNADGTLRADQVANFKALGQRALSQMERDGEISAYEIVINPNQNVVSTSKLELTAKIVPVGVAREIVVNLGFVPSL